MKQAGFWWHPAQSACVYSKCKVCQAGKQKVWWTSRPEIITRLEGWQSLCTYDAREAAGKADQAIQQSRAASNDDVVIPAPEGLTYMPFQRAGIAYAMQRNGTLLADEMGLGKTIQALGLVNAINAKNVLIVVPASLRLNWEREATKWIVGARSIEVVLKPKAPCASDIVIVNYERVRGDIFQKLMARTWDLLIVDESHYVKNATSQRTKNVMGSWTKKTGPIPGLASKADRQIYLTGTPILNRPKEIHTILAKLEPRQFGNFMTFAKRYCAAFYNGYGWDFNGASNMTELQTRLRASCMVRRLKADVLKELPPKTRQLITLAPNGMTQLVKKEQQEWLNLGGQSFEDLRADVELADASEDSEAYNSAVRRLDTLVKFAFDTMSKQRLELAVKKIPLVLAHCDDVLESVDKLVIFAHHHHVLDALAEHYGDRAVKLDGRTSLQDRQAAIDRFQTDNTCKVFIGSIKAAGVGITLTASSHVVFAELSWVPADLSQAEDRCHRIGQDGNVTVQHLVVDGSMDALLAETLMVKQAIIDLVLDTQADKIAIPDVAAQAKTKRKWPQATQAQRDACVAALNQLSGQCDGAFQQDGVGFNKFDSRIGKKLAIVSGTRSLTDGEVFLCGKMLSKYHGQIGTELVSSLRGTNTAGGGIHG